jgi:hypothetical protein
LKAGRAAIDPAQFSLATTPRRHTGAKNFRQRMRENFHKAAKKRL